MGTRLLDLTLLRTFVLVSEERNLTRVAKRLNRTQPAISLQLDRLEHLIDCRLFQPVPRRMQLTGKGELLLSYARRMLDLNQEAWSRFEADEVSGRVVLGCPDLYAAFLLPRTLARFEAAYPGVEVMVRCALSQQVAQAMEKGEIDVAVATHRPGAAPNIPAVTPLRRERLVWMGATEGAAHRREPLPIAMLPEGNLYRDHAIAALNARKRSWRIACVSESIAGLQAVVLADTAVCVLGASVEVAGLRRLGRADGLPSLPPVELVLWQRAPGRSTAADRLAASIEADIGSEAPTG